MTVLDKAMKRLRCFVALSYSVYDKFRSCKNIAAHKYITLTCLICIFLSLWIISSMELYTLSLQELSPLDLLAYSEDYFCSRQSDSLIFVVLRIKFSFFIEYGNTAFKYNANNLSILFNYFLWTPTTLDFNAIFPCFLYLKLWSRHYVFCLKRKHSYLLSSATLTDARSINSYVSTSNYHCFIGELEFSSICSM